MEEPHLSDRIEYEHKRNDSPTQVLFTSASGPIMTMMMRMTRLIVWCSTSKYIYINKVVYSLWRQLPLHLVALLPLRCCTGHCKFLQVPASAGAESRSGTPPAWHWWRAAAAHMHCGSRCIASGWVAWDSDGEQYSTACIRFGTLIISLQSSKWLYQMIPYGWILFYFGPFGRMNAPTVVEQPETREKK